MLLDLILVLLAAFLLGALPGYYWARCLFATSDIVVRATYSIGLSITLVPAVALVPARLLGQGVTLSATAVSALLVFGTGLAAYYVLETEKDSGQPVAQPARTPGLVTLLSLAGALSLALAASVGAVEPRRAVFLAAGLVTVAGILYLSEPSPEKDLPPSGEPEPSRERNGSPGARHLLLGAGFAYRIGAGVTWVLFCKTGLTSGGVDHYSHAVMANQMLSTGTFEEYLIYPPGFHTMTATLSTLSGLEPIDVFPVLGPMLFVLSSLALYALASRLWGWEHGVAAASLRWPAARRLVQLPQRFYVSKPRCRTVFVGTWLSTAAVQLYSTLPRGDPVLAIGSPRFFCSPFPSSV